MKFIYRIIIGLSACMLVFMAAWGIFFFRAMEEEINDETDDMLEEYSADIIMKWLSGVDIPAIDNGSNNTYYIRRVSPGYAASVPKISYENSMIYIASKGEKEAARIRHHVFMDSDDTYYELIVAVPTFDRQDLINAILRWMVFLYFIMLVACIGITVAVVNYNFRPLKALVRWTDSYIPGKTKEPVPCNTSITEFKTLARATQEAADRFERQYELQNQFIGNASHELQTPLAVCTGKIEMLLDSEELTMEQAEELMSVNTTLRKMIRLNRTLLLMTKIDNGQFLDVSAVDIVSVVQDLLPMFGEMYSYKGIKTDCNAVSPLIVEMNEQLSTILVSNLLKNAFVHSPSGAAVSVSVAGRTLEVSNDGDTPLDGDRIFDRFYHGPDKENVSTGLGLALVKSICDRYSFGLRYSYEGKHVFRIEFSCLSESLSRFASEKQKK